MVGRVSSRVLHSLPYLKSKTLEDENNNVKHKVS